jgi:hypothetical protein
MSKACDRCGKAVHKHGITFKFKGLIKKFINNIDEIIYRERDGEPHPEYRDFEFYGKMDLCEECTNEFAEWLSIPKTNGDG